MGLMMRQVLWRVPIIRASTFARMAFVGVVISVAGCDPSSSMSTSRSHQQEFIQAKVAETFQLSDADRWQFRTPERWQVEGPEGRRYLSVHPAAKAAGEAGGSASADGRGRLEYAMFRPYQFRSFAWSCFVRVDPTKAASKTTGKTAAELTSSESTPGDVRVIFGWQDETHYYDVLLSALLSGASAVVTRVDGHSVQPLSRSMSLSSPESKAGVLTDGAWHKIDILRNSDTGSIQIYVDAYDEQTRPCFETKDTRYEWGSIGVGSIETPAQFAKILIEGQARTDCVRVDGR